MAAAERAYMFPSEYQNEKQEDRYREPLYSSAYPKRKGEEGRIRRTRERPKQEDKTRQTPAGLTVTELRQMVAITVAVAVLLMGILILNAYAANIQCSINALTKKNMALEDEIDRLSMQIDESTSIEQIESYAMKELHMTYPRSSQAIYIPKDKKLMDNFSKILRQKAYGKG